MKKLKVIFLIMAALAILVSISVLSGCSENKNEEESTGLLIKNEKGAYWQKDAASQQGKTVVFETDKGNIEVKLYECSLANEFLSQISRFEGIDITIVAENMFIQAENVESFTGPSDYMTDLLCVNGAVGFVVEDGNLTGSLIVITSPKLNTISENSLIEHCDDDKKIEFYQNLGGIPEYEGYVAVFGQMISGKETIGKISGLKTNGYVNGYVLEEPVNIKSIKK